MTKEYTTTKIDYEDYVIEFGAYQGDTLGDWFGVFRVHEEGIKIHGEDLHSPADTHVIAESNARQHAIDYVDDLMKKKAESDH